jgi:hypothetical protein
MIGLSLAVAGASSSTSAAKDVPGPAVSNGDEPERSFDLVPVAALLAIDLGNPDRRGNLLAPRNGTRAH